MIYVEGKYDAFYDILRECIMLSMQIRKTELAERRRRRDLQNQYFAGCQLFALYLMERRSCEDAKLPMIISHDIQVWIEEVFFVEAIPMPKDIETFWKSFNKSGKWDLIPNG